MKLYWATSYDAEAWRGPCATDDECVADARWSARSGAWREMSGFDGEAIWIAPLDDAFDSDDRFWDAVAGRVLWRLEDLGSDMAEDGWTDPEDDWPGVRNDRDRILANALRQTLGPRPKWRTVDTAKARRVEL